MAHVRWAEEIATDLQVRFGATVKEAVTIEKGWLNVKWKMETDRGPLFVKFYHPERYKLHSRPDRRKSMENTLHLQQGLSAAGIPCPRVYHHHGQFIQQTPSCMDYAVLDWVDGHTVQAGCLNDVQLFHLGSATGRMHTWLRSAAPADHLTWKPDKEAYLQEWKVNWERAQESGDTVVLEWLDRSRAIVESTDFRMFDACPAGWLHWDLWVDNILINGQEVAGIVDFDRMAFAYPEIDVVRAILSGALLDGEMKIKSVQAFMEGYRTHAEAPPSLLPRALRLLYLIESLWWLRTEVRGDMGLRSLLARFVEEMHWIEDHWENLPDL